MAGVFDLELGHEEGDAGDADVETDDDAIEVDQVRGVSICRPMLLSDCGLSDTRPRSRRWTCTSRT